jgi:outer membrane immunogenic protein
MAGVRYRLPRPWMHGEHALRPFAQLIVGGAHAGGGMAGVADGTSAFAGRIGGGIDLPINAGLAIRLVQGDYYMTTFANSADNRQNNLLFGAGIVLHWYR